jgi:hypothetical protein
MNLRQIWLNIDVSRESRGQPLHPSQEKNVSRETSARQEICLDFAGLFAKTFHVKRFELGDGLS